MRPAKIHQCGSTILCFSLWTSCSLWLSSSRLPMAKKSPARMPCWQVVMNLVQPGGVPVDTLGASEAPTRHTVPRKGPRSINVGSRTCCQSPTPQGCVNYRCINYWFLKYIITIIIDLPPYDWYRQATSRNPSLTTSHWWECWARKIAANLTNTAGVSMTSGQHGWEFFLFTLDPID